MSLFVSSFLFKSNARYFPYTEKYAILALIARLLFYYRHYTGEMQ